MDYDWNPFTYFSPDDRHGVFAQWTQYLVSEDRFHPHLVESWHHGDGELVLTLSEGFTWAKHGDPVTAEDLAFQLRVYDAANHVPTRYVDRVSAIDDHQFRIFYPEGTNGELIEYTILPLLADVPPENWAGDSWQDDPSAVRVSDPDASGPLRVADLTDNGSMTSVRHESDESPPHRLADHYNWEGYRYLYVSSEGGVFRWAEVDGLHGSDISGTDRTDQPDSVRRIQFSGGFGMGLWFDHTREPWSDRRVRQAFLETIDLEAAVVPNLGDTMRFDHAQTGLTSSVREPWLGADRPDGFATYDGGPSAAEALLAEAGYEPADVEFEITYPGGWAEWAIVCQSIVEQLQDAGWSAAGNRESGGGMELFEQGDTAVTAYSHKPHREIPPNNALPHHPYFALEFILQGHYDEDRHFANYDPGTVSVDGQQVDIDAELERLASDAPSEVHRRTVRRLARVVNRDLPCAIVMENLDEAFIDTEQFDLPDSSPHLRSRWPQWWLPKVDQRLPGYETPGLMKFRPE